MVYRFMIRFSQDREASSTLAWRNVKSMPTIMHVDMNFRFCIFVLSSAMRMLEASQPLLPRKLVVATIDEQYGCETSMGEV